MTVAIAASSDITPPTTAPVFDDLLSFKGVSIVVKELVVSVSNSCLHLSSERVALGEAMHQGKMFQTIFMIDISSHELSVGTLRPSPGPALV